MHDVLFCHWRVDPEAIASRIPRGLTLDTWDRSAWVGMLVHQTCGVRHRLGPSVPGLRNFFEIDLRTYVTAGLKPGVFYFEMDVSSRIASSVAQMFFHAPFTVADIQGRMQMPDEFREVDRRSDAGRTIRLRYRPAGTPFLPRKGTLEHWVAHRYCCYTRGVDARPRRIELDHPPLQFQPTEWSARPGNLGESLGLNLAPTAALSYMVSNVPVHVWSPDPA